MYKCYNLKYFVIVRGGFIIKFNKNFRRAFITTLPIMAGFIFLGIGFGIILLSKGYGVFWSFLMATFIYAGSMQYVAINLITGGASLITTALTTLMVNARYLFYGVSMIEKYKNAGRKKFYMIFTLTDEGYSLICNDKSELNEKDKVETYFYISLFSHIYWIIGCVLGSVLGNFIPFSVEGIDFALTALFVVVFVEQWLTTKNHIYAISGVISSVICLLIFGKENFLIPTMILITVVVTILKFVNGGKK